MKKIPIGIARKILQLIEGEHIAASKLSHSVIDDMLANEVLSLVVQGRSRKSYYAKNARVVANYLHNQLGIENLNVYVQNLEIGTTRAENIVAGSDSKLTKQRTFKGFVVNCHKALSCQILGNSIQLLPQEGSYCYIHDYESFQIPENVLVVGIENPENFKIIRQQIQLFESDSLLFVCRYPQSKDLVRWLQQIPNKYLHFGDFDFEGIRIFRDEYYLYLADRASFFIPKSIAPLLKKYGNKALYDRQHQNTRSLELNSDLADLMQLFHRYKKCLEQEVFINFQTI